MAARSSNNANWFETTLTNSMGPTDLTAAVASTAGAPTSPCYLVIEPDTPSQREVVFFDGTFTSLSFVTSDLANRYLAGSAAASGLTHPAGSVVKATPVAQHMEDVHDRIDAQEVVTSQGDLIRGSASGGEERLPLGTSRHVVQSDGTNVVYDVVHDASLASNSVTTAKIVNDAVTNDKLASMERGSVKVGGASDAPTDLDAKTAGQVLVGDGTDVVSVPVSGDASFTAAGVLTLGAGSVSGAKIADGSVVAAKIADGSVTTAKLADDSVTAAKIDETAMAVIRVVADQAARDALTPAAGWLVFQQSNATHYFYDGTAWKRLARFVGTDSDADTYLLLSGSYQTVSTQQVSAPLDGTFDVVAWASGETLLNSTTPANSRASATVTIEISTDGGTTWSTGAEVNQDVESSDAKHNNQTWAVGHRLDGVTITGAVQSRLRARHISVPGVSATAMDINESSAHLLVVEV